jgi:hypothetical protein
MLQLHPFLQFHVVSKTTSMSFDPDNIMSTSSSATCAASLDLLAMPGASLPLQLVCSDTQHHRFSTAANQSDLGWGRFAFLVMQKRHIRHSRYVVRMSSIQRSVHRHWMTCQPAYLRTLLWLAACITMLIRFFAPCILSGAHCASSLLKYRHDQ